MQLTSPHLGEPNDGLMNDTRPTDVMKAQHCSLKCINILYLLMWAWPVSAAKLGRTHQQKCTITSLNVARQEMWGLWLNYPKNLPWLSHNEDRRYNPCFTKKMTTAEVIKDGLQTLVLGLWPEKRFILITVRWKKRIIANVNEIVEILCFIVRTSTTTVSADSRTFLPHLTEKLNKISPHMQSQNDEHISCDLQTVAR